MTQTWRYSRSLETILLDRLLYHTVLVVCSNHVYILPKMLPLIYRTWLAVTLKSPSACYKLQRLTQGNHRSHFACTVHSHRPLPGRCGMIHFVAIAAETEWSLLLHDVIGDWMIPFAANALQCIVNGKENPKTAPSPLDFVTLPEEDRATAIGNMHRKIDNDRACGSGDVLADDRQTDRQTDTQRCAHHNTLPPLPQVKQL